MPYSGTFSSGTVVTLEADAATGSIFTSWSGDLSGSTNPTSIRMTSDRSVTVNFTQQYTLDIAKGGSGSGTVKVNDVSESLPYSGTFSSGTVVKLEADAATGSIFTSWSGDLSGSTNPTSISMTSDRSVTGNFTQQYTLDIAKGGSGSGTVKLNDV